MQRKDTCDYFLWLDELLDGNGNGNGKGKGPRHSCCCSKIVNTVEYSAKRIVKIERRLEMDNMKLNFVLVFVAISVVSVLVYQCFRH